jgi:methyl-accepting chemotaxis protein
MKQSLIELGNEKSQHIQSQLYLKDIRFHIVQIQQFLTDASLTGNQEPIQEAEDNKIQALQIAQELKTLEPNLKDEIQGTENKIEALFDTGIEMVSIYKAEGQAAGNIIMTRPDTGFDDRSISLATAFEKLTKHVNQRVGEIDLEYKKAQTNVSRSATFSAIIQLFILAGLVALVILRIIPAILRLNQSIESLGTGDKDLSRRLTIRRNDELGKIAQSINAFTGQLDSMTSAIKMAGKRLIGITSGFQQSSAQASNGMQSIHQHTDMLATAVTEMTSLFRKLRKIPCKPRKLPTKQKKQPLLEKRL